MHSATREPSGGRGTDPSGQPHGEGASARLNWLRAAVLGTNDGIVSVAGIVLGVAGATAQRGPIFTAGLAGLVAGGSRGRGCVASAGSHPKPRLHPNAVRVMTENYDIDLSHRRPKPLTAIARRRFDYVITLCDKVREFPRDDHSATAMHWSLPDPAAAADSNRASYRQFLRVATELDTRIGFLLPVLANHADEG